LGATLVVAKGVADGIPELVSGHDGDWLSEACPDCPVLSRGVVERTDVVYVWGLRPVAEVALYFLREQRWDRCAVDTSRWRSAVGANGLVFSDGRFYVSIQHDSGYALLSISADCETAVEEEFETDRWVEQLTVIEGSLAVLESSRTPPRSYWVRELRGHYAGRERMFAQGVTLYPTTESLGDATIAVACETNAAQLKNGGLRLWVLTEQRVDEVRLDEPCAETSLSASRASEDSIAVAYTQFQGERSVLLYGEFAAGSRLWRSEVVPIP
jgi:hypothetical protein